MKFQLLDGVLMNLDKNIGLEEILGVNIGGKMACSELLEAKTILQLNHLAIMLCQKTPGLRILEKQLNLFNNLKFKTNGGKSYSKVSGHVFEKTLLKLSLLLLINCLMKKSAPKIFLKAGIGEMSMELTT
jgi:hypothetical protein